MAVNGVGATGNSGGVTVETPYEEDKKTVAIDDFLQLMIAEITNQDFTTQKDSSQYVTQLAQITTMQQMEQLAYYSKSNYVMSMVGKEATAASLGYGGKVNKVTGIVEKVGLSGGEFSVYVDGKPFKLNQIMSINSPTAVDNDDQKVLAKLREDPVVITQTKVDSATVRWNLPQVTEGTKDSLKYEVYYMAVDNAGEKNTFDTVDDIKKGTLAGIPEDGEALKKITDLNANTKYYVNVIVTSKDGKQYAYQKTILTTETT